ncbi:MAG: N-6 DNA methylase [Halobacteriovoraceae bacterium]|jgi:adenine-specific DNA-methyltransferase|nr:N-6 DNA methylase [Halobacteriovoraceae bacterium]
MLANNLNNKSDEQENMQLDLNSSLRNIAYWESTLFSKVYLGNDLKRDFSEKWDKDYDDVVFDDEGESIKSGFYHFYNEFRNIAESLRGLSKKKLSETDTITKMIAPLLDALGWYDNCSNNVEEPYAAETSFTVKAKPRNKTYRTDMILVNYPAEASFISDSDDTEKRKREAREHCIAPLEAKYWNRIVEKEKSKIKEDKRRANKETDDTGVATSFNEQVLNYMNILHKKWGIVTDGNIWRLVNNDISGESPERCFEFKIESLLSQEAKIESGEVDDVEFLENAKYFYLFFGKASYVKDDVGKIFLDEVLKESRKYIDSIEEDLKDRFISAMNITCDGLLKAAKEKGTITKPTDEDLKLIRTVAESHLFNILFIKSCEARGVLPTKSPKYYEISLTSIIDRISVFDPEKYIAKKDREYINMRLSKSLRSHKFKPDGHALYKNLIRLTEVIHDGAKKDDFGFEIKGFRENIFSDTECVFAKKHCLTDEQMVRIFFELGYSKASAFLQRNYQQIPYNYFTPRQLGSIYESFLEYKLGIAKEPMVYLKKGKYKQWMKLTASIQNKLKGFEPIVKVGQAFFTPDNAERKATGSYYTPDFIVQYIIKETLTSICEGKNSKELLEVKVCDAAMGSGHFLIGALNFLTSYYLKALEDEQLSADIPSKEEAKRVVLDKCIFGVDINPRAVKLAKMSLWLESAHWGKKLERLDDQLINSNALVEETIWPEYKNIMDSGFSAVVGNPPYIGEKGNKHLFEDVKGGRLSKYYQGKMDYFYFFFHLGLDMLAPKGRLGFITTNYFPTAAGARVLRIDLQERASSLALIQLNENKVFESASGQHNMISILERGGPCDAISAINIPKNKNFEKEYFKEQVQSAKLLGRFESNESYIRIVSAYDEILCQISNISDLCLGDEVNVNTGLFTACDNVFIHAKGELERLIKMNKIEKDIILPLFKNSDVRKFSTETTNKRSVIYHYEKAPYKREDIPNIMKYLAEHKDKLKNRKDNSLKGALKRGRWDVMALPKTAIDFSGPKIVAPQRSRVNTFGYNDVQWYASADVYFITAKKSTNLDLYYLLGVLNSKLYYMWLYFKGKRKGEMLELYQKPLSEIPIKSPTSRESSFITQIVRKLIKNNSGVSNFDDLNNEVYKIYNLSREDILRVEKFYDGNIGFTLEEELKEAA